MTTINAFPMQRSRGMRDLLPVEMRAFRRIEDAFRAAASRWGYEELRTPTIETYSLFTAAGALTPQMLSRVYSFLDWDGWSGERVVLRPDSTIPVARAVADASIALPARLYYIQNVFRFSESGDREDWQCGAEYLGAPAPLGDLEVASLAAETFDALGLGVEVRLSHVGIIRALADAMDGDSARLLELVTEGGLEVIAAGAGQTPALASFVQVALQKGGPELLANLRALATHVAPGTVAAIDELAAIAGALAESGRKVVVDLTMPRDFDYYTGTVFEFTALGESWGSGGRYTPAGSDQPGSACGLGLDASRLAAHLATAIGERTVAAIVPASPADLARAIATARALHRSGIAASLASSPGASAIVVEVGGERLRARTPAGEHDLSSLDGVVELLVQYK